jgi:hypothetical protein
MKLNYVLLLLIISAKLHAQTRTYVEDLNALKSIVQKTASFKAQIKGDKLADYNKLYNRLLADSNNSTSSIAYFYNLSKMLFPIRDNHVGFYQLPNYDHFKTKESIDSFVSSKLFGEYPTVTMNIDSLMLNLATKPVDSVEGIYHYGKFYRVGVFKNNDKEYIGVVLDSEINLWKKGQIAFYLYESDQHIYKAIYGHPYLKFFIFQPIEKYQNQSLVYSSFYGSFTQEVYAKKIKEVEYVNLPKQSQKFSFKNINDSIQYILIQTFQANSATSQISQRFHDSISNLLNKPYLILDLRNNEGGAEKEMNKYLKLLKNYTKKGQLVLLVNNGTLSQAEIFTLELKQLNNVTVLGQQTKGMLAYGSNYGRKQKLPSGNFEIYPTDMNNGTALLSYEDYGIKPDIILRADQDWIEQAVYFIKGKK